jgi:methyl-accepting chemotaxis protein
MAQPVLNELLEEAAQRCDALAQNADRTLALLEDTLAGAEQLADTIEAATTETRERLTDLASEMDEAAGELADRGEKTDSALDGLARRAEQVQGTVREVLDRVRAGLEALSAGRQAIAGRFKPDAETADQQVGDALDKMGELQKLLASELEKAGQSVQAFQQTLESAQKEWESRLTDFGEAFEALAKDVQEKTEAYATEIADILDNQRVDVLVQKLTNEMLIDSHNAAVDELGLHYETEVPAAAEEQLARLRTAVDDLERLCAEHAGVLRGKWVEIATKAGEAKQAFAALVPVLQDAQQVP